MVGDLLACGFEPRMLFATEAWSVERGVWSEKRGAWSEECGVRSVECGVWSEEREILQIVSEDELRRISFLQHPQQVLGVFAIKVPVKDDTGADGLVLALDGVQDPGNLGTIIRIADWFGITTIYCSEDTTDAWSPKVVQATMGSIARVNIVYTDLTVLLKETEKPVYGTLLDGDSLYEQPLSANGIIVMGNEGNGISPEVRPLIGHRLLIPRYHEGPESLNVAIATAIGS